MEEDLFTREYKNCGEIQSLIDELEDNCPDKRTREYGIWEKKINFLIKKYNKLCKFKAFKERGKGKDAPSIPGNMEEAST